MILLLIELSMLAIAALAFFGFMLSKKMIWISLVGCITIIASTDSLLAKFFYGILLVCTIVVLLNQAYTYGSKSTREQLTGIKTEQLKK